MTRSQKHTDESERMMLEFSFITAVVAGTIPIILMFLTDDMKVEAQSPEIDASNVYETKSLTLGDNIKNFIILIPNEAHESQLPGDITFEDRHIDQPYIPQNATVTKGTAVVWFNGDVDHDHKITLTGQDPTSSSQLFDSNVFAFNTASQPIVMNDTGSFGYHETDVNEEDTDYVMEGTINVVDQSASPTITTGNSTDQPSVNIDTVGTLMVPTEDLSTYTSDLENGGISVLSTHNFIDIRGEDPQTLITWGASSGTNSLENIASQLSEITPTLPYS
jgi:plastocyanin